MNVKFEDVRCIKITYSMPVSMLIRFYKSIETTHG